MSRLTRAESQTRNREQVLSAARELFMRDGYLATSLAAIADHAGFSTGVVYSNFAGKAELGLHVVRQIQAEQLADLRAAIGHQRPPQEIITAFRTWSERAVASGWPRLELEFALDVRSDPALVAAEATRQRSVVADIVVVLRTIVPRPLAEVLPLEALADSILNLAIGFAVRHLIDPKASLEPLEKLLLSALAMGS